MPSPQSLHDTSIVSGQRGEDQACDDLMDMSFPGAGLNPFSAREPGGWPPRGHPFSCPSNRSDHAMLSGATTPTTFCGLTPSTTAPPSEAGDDFERLNPRHPSCRSCRCAPSATFTGPRGPYTYKQLASLAQRWSKQAATARTASEDVTPRSAAQQSAIDGPEGKVLKSFEHMRVDNLSYLDYIFYQGEELDPWTRPEQASMLASWVNKAQGVPETAAEALEVASTMSGIDPLVQRLELAAGDEAEVELAKKKEQVSRRFRYS